MQTDHEELARVLRNRGSDLPRTYEEIFALSLKDKRRALKEAK